MNDAKKKTLTFIFASSILIIFSGFNLALLVAGVLSLVAYIYAKKFNFKQSIFLLIGGIVLLVGAMISYIEVQIPADIQDAMNQALENMDMKTVYEEFLKVETQIKLSTVFFAAKYVLVGAYLFMMRFVVKGFQEIAPENEIYQNTSNLSLRASIYSAALFLSLIITMISLFSFVKKVEFDSSDNIVLTSVPAATFLIFLLTLLIAVASSIALLVAEIKFTIKISNISKLVMVVENDEHNNFDDNSYYNNDNVIDVDSTEQEESDEQE